MYHYKIPSMFPVGSVMPVDELAKRCCSGDVHSDDKMNRLIEHAVSNYLLVQESPGGPISHSAVSAMMAHVPALHDWVGSACEDMWPSAPHVVNALQKKSLTVQTGHNLAERTSANFFQTLRTQPDRMSRFANSITIMQNMPGYDASAALEAYDWPSLCLSLPSDEANEKLLVVVLRPVHSVNRVTRLYYGVSQLTG